MHGVLTLSPTNKGEGLHRLFTNVKAFLSVVINKSLHLHDFIKGKFLKAFLSVQLDYVFQAHLLNHCF